MVDINYALAALGATATGSGAGGGTVPGNMIDGSDVTYFQWGTAGTYYAQVDLGSPQYITSVELLQGEGAGQYSPAGILAFSDDGTDWSTLDALTPGPGLTQVQTGGLTHRYWKYTRSSGTGPGVRFHTFAVIGPSEAPPPPENTNCDNMQAWLDGLDAYWVPCVQAWLDAN